VSSSKNVRHGLAKNVSANDAEYRFSSITWGEMQRPRVAWNMKHRNLKQV